MPRHSCSITLQLERDSDYQFLNGLRMASGYPAHHPAHISLICQLSVLLAPDAARSELGALVGKLQRVAGRARPFSAPALTSLVAALEARQDTYISYNRQRSGLTVRGCSVKRQLGWVRKSQSFRPHLTLDSSVLSLHRIATICNAQRQCGNPLGGHVTGLELWEHKEGQRILRGAFPFQKARPSRGHAHPWAVLGRGRGGAPSGWSARW
ncbi:hypothetical protein HWV62_33079 [Athelia sp. TMB]|nr:hypothetical protein HWV62_33079 [Athelia sp. TMB]